jgi:hypothetical protein
MLPIYLAQVLVVTKHDDDVPPLIAKLRAELDREIVGARCVVKQLQQGPPVESPIQVRLIGDELYVLRAKADEVANAVRDAGGYKVHDDLGRRMPVVQIDIDQEHANTLGIRNSQVGRIAQSAFAGVKVTELREGDRRRVDPAEPDRWRTVASTDCGSHFRPVVRHLADPRGVAGPLLYLLRKAALDKMRTSTRATSAKRWQPRVCCSSMLRAHANNDCKHHSE